MMAWRAEDFASVRVVHHLMRRNERNPTPSHPMKNKNRFSAAVSISILSRKIIKSRKNFLLNGSLCM